MGDVEYALFNEPNTSVSVVAFYSSWKCCVFSIQAFLQPVRLLHRDQRRKADIFSFFLSLCIPSVLPALSSLQEMKTQAPYGRFVFFLEV